MSWRPRRREHGSILCQMWHNIDPLAAHGSARSGGGEEVLHQGHVEPAVELAADLALDADQLEAAPRMQRPRRRAARLDPREHGVEAGQGSDVEQLGDEQATDPASVAGTI